MPGSVRYFNQTAPFWDFVADMEGRSNDRGASDNEEEHQHQNQQPWSEGWAGFPWGPFPHRGRRHGPPHHHHGPPPPPEGGPPPAEGDSEGEAGPSEPRGPPPPFSDHEAGAPEDRRSHHGGRHGHGPHHGPRGRGGPEGQGRGRCGGRGGWGGRGRGHFHPYAMGGEFGGLAELFQSQLFGEDSSNKNNNEDFKPEVDVFDTTEAFIVHVSLPGAKKEDVGVNWDAEKSELSVAGVIYRPGDEELLKTLALDERKVGAFERKIRLGSRANPAQVDVDGIVAKLEDGILRVEVPKLDSGYVEIKKVDVE
ncbi:hypothetical protein DOTSEDRAFT_69170 [Dothistroma septosporum NZE10]|uniref:SHSP domain-containing protein n=1 Tax=Dothistroma septosporum (strain NZE10 / CBS 128990) TaxID=675120 RepID=N1PUI4_DOTSN|nr:hypothetical protein DOTSEDRAFT_69170 [Dothistroma septosporum NZE10]